MIKNKTALYCHYNTEGTLLYTGISSNAMKRLEEHKQSPWILDISRIDIQYFESRQEARDAEKDIIKTKNPLFNKAHKQRLPTLVEEMYERISNSTEEELRTTPIYFKNIEVYFAFLEVYSKHARKMNKQKENANARPVPSGST
jgi:predicted GIY-YIG superfamily endonuclease